MSEEIKNDTLEKATTEGVFAVGGVGGVITPEGGVGNTPVANYGQFGTPTSVNPHGTGTNFGLLPPDQAGRFIDYIWDSTVLAKEGRHVTMRANSMELSKTNIGERLVRAANQADGDYINAGARFSKIELTTKKVRLDWEISSETLEDNIEGGAFEDRIVRMMTSQFGNDIEDMAINGVGDGVDPFLGVMKGFIAQAKEGGHEVVNTAKIDELDPSVFQGMLSALPRRYRALKTGFKFYAGSNTFMDAVLANGIRSDAVYQSPANRDAYMSGANQVTGPAGVQTRILGVPLVEVPHFPEGYIELTVPQNRIWGIQREIKVAREWQTKKDTVEWTVFMRFGIAWEELDAMAWLDIESD